MKLTSIFKSHLAQHVRKLCPGSKVKWYGPVLRIYDLDQSDVRKVEMLLSAINAKLEFENSMLKCGDERCCGYANNYKVNFKTKRKFLAFLR